MRRHEIALALIAVGACLSHPHTAIAAWSVAPTVVIGTLDECRWATACTDGAGGALVACQQTASGAPGVLAFRHVLATGELDPAWPSAARLSPVATYTSGPHLLADGLGGAYAWWLEGIELYLNHLGSDGLVVPGWPARGRWLTTMGSTTDPFAIVLDASHGIYAAWMSGGPYDTPDVRAIHLSASNALADGWPDSALAVVPPAADGSTQRYWPHLAPAPNGDLFLAFGMWENVGAVYVHESRLIRLTGSGAPAPGWPAKGRTLFTASATEVWVGPILDIDADGRGGVFAIVCPGGYVSTARVLRVDGNGNAAADWPSGGVLFSTSAYGNQGASASYWPAVIGDLADGVFAAVPVAGGLHYSPSWLYRHFDATGVRTDSGNAGFAAIWSLVPTGGRAHFLADQDDGYWGFSYSGAYQRITHAAADGAGTTSLSDYHDPTELQLFWGARLVPTTEGGAIWVWSQVQGLRGVFARRFAADGTAVTDVAVAAARLALSSARWTAGLGVRARVSLDSNDGGDLSLYDVTGRRISSARIEPGRAGTREITLPRTAGLSSGVYFVRVVTRTGERSEKVPVLR